MSIEDRRKHIHGGLTADLPVADILASHSPYLHKANHFLSTKGVIKPQSLPKYKNTCDL